jgi:hypothetical protein
MHFQDFKNPSRLKKPISCSAPYHIFFFICFCSPISLMLEQQAFKTFVPIKFFQVNLILVSKPMIPPKCSTFLCPTLWVRFWGLYCEIFYVRQLLLYRGKLGCLSFSVTSILIRYLQARLEV